MKKKMFRISAMLLALCLMLQLSCFAKAEITIESVTRQDPNNVILLWENSGNQTYQVYRAETINGKYEEIGTTETGSFRDTNAQYPKEYYYKIKASGVFSKPAAIGTNPQKVHSVVVMMYHNFISEEDIANGVEFEEYSLTPAEFESDLAWLKSNGYTTITSADLISFLKREKALPEKAIILSIDDGTQGVYTNAWPLLKRYNMKADFNLIGQNIDTTWENLHNGGTRDGETAPYCTWEELVEMSDSGEINLCSHSYALHRYNKNKRIGMQPMEGETETEYIAEAKRDYQLMVQCIEGWAGKKPQAVAYPYSKRTEVSDRLLLEHTGYEILMAGARDRGTAGNYFVAGCDFENQLRLMSRPCRMAGVPISEYIAEIEKQDFANGVNRPADPLNLETSACLEIAKSYQTFDDVAPNAWYAGSVYYSFVNGFMRGTASDKFSPDKTINRAMAATLLHRVAGTPRITSACSFDDVAPGAWYGDAAAWAHANGILEAASEGRYQPDAPIRREDLANAIYKCAISLGMNREASADLSKFKDAGRISPACADAIEWCVANGVFQGNANGTFRPEGYVTRSEMSMVLQNWFRKFAN